MTGNSSFPSDRWRGATIKREQDSLRQPKPRWDALIVCSAPVGIAYLIAAVTNCYHTDRWDLLLTFSEWFLLRSVLWERHAEMRNKVDDSSEREQIGCSLLESQKRLHCLANVFMVHNLGQFCHRLHLTPLFYRGPQPVGVCVRDSVREKAAALLIQCRRLNKNWATEEDQNTESCVGVGKGSAHICRLLRFVKVWKRKTVVKNIKHNPTTRLWQICRSFTYSIDVWRM